MILLVYKVNLAISADEAMSQILDWVNKENPMSGDSDNDDDLGDIYMEEMLLLGSCINSKIWNVDRYKKCLQYFDNRGDGEFNCRH